MTMNTTNKRLEHLQEGRRMLDYITPMIKNDEQRRIIDEKKALLDEWIAEMTQSG